MSDTIKVKRDGPRGWHNIAAASFDPEKHERYDADAAPAVKSDDTIVELKADDQITDEQLREAIESATGKKPHWKTRRENLIEQFHAINGV